MLKHIKAQMMASLSCKPSGFLLASDDRKFAFIHGGLPPKS